MSNNSSILQLISAEADKINDQVIAWRRHFHSNPELGFCEEETSEFIADILSQLNLKVSTRVAKTGVIALLEGSGKGPTIALRADMDALPITEETDLAFASKREGVMHACGHDVHVAVLLGAATVLSKLKDNINGKVLFIFQPSEEKHPGGAIGIINSRHFNPEEISCIIGLHVNPHYPSGIIGVKEGTMMASADTFKLTIIGSGGHGASPHQAVDPIVMSAQVINALQTISSRLINPTDPVVITIGKINGGTAPNIIPNKVELEGTCRCLSQDVRDSLKDMIENITSGIVKGYGGDFHLEHNLGYPPVVNNMQMVNLIKETGKEVLGAGKVLGIAAPSMGGEDFAYYSEQVPGVFFQLGVAPDTGIIYPLHHPKFEINEKALKTGVKIMTRAALKAVELFEKGDDPAT